MKNILTSWFFFASLTIFLLVSATVMPHLFRGFFGKTEAAVQQTVTELEQSAQAVWAEIGP